MLYLYIYMLLVLYPLVVTDSGSLEWAKQIIKHNKMPDHIQIQDNILTTHT